MSPAKFAALALVAVGCGQVSPTSAASATPLKAPASARGHLPASGEIHLPAASAFGEPGFHEPIAVNAKLPADIAPNSVRGLVVTLRDAGRPGQTCGSEHPLSGCATVDWSDATSRPRVPPGGVFNNSVVLSLATGPLTLFLRADGTMARSREPYDPGWPHSAVGGSAREWKGTILPSDPMPGGELALNLVMTKFGAPAVTIAFEVQLRAQ